MKRNVKHKFTHRDPEIISAKKTETGKVAQKNDDFSLIRKDLKRTAITIAVFVLAICIIYVIKIRTDWFTVLLSKVGL